MTKLTDMQRVLLSTAAARNDGNLLPPADSLGAFGERIRRSIASLITKGLASEVEVSHAERAWRSENIASFGVTVTDIGRALLDPPITDGLDDDTSTAAALPSSPEGESAPHLTKPEQVVNLLRRPGGISITEIASSMGWLPHLARAVLTGLRKKGHAINKCDREGVTIYSIEAN